MFIHLFGYLENVLKNNRRLLAISAVYNIVISTTSEVSDVGEKMKKITLFAEVE